MTNTGDKVTIFTMSDDKYGGLSHNLYDVRWLIQGLKSQFLRCHMTNTGAKVTTFKMLDTGAKVTIFTMSDDKYRGPKSQLLNC